jgi:hypothetical protein
MRHIGRFLQKDPAFSSIANPVGFVNGAHIAGNQTTVLLQMQTTPPANAFLTETE